MFTHIYIGKETTWSHLANRTGMPNHPDYVFISDPAHDLSEHDLISEAIAKDKDTFLFHFHSDGSSIVGGNPLPWRIIVDAEGQVIGVEPTVIMRGRDGGRNPIGDEPMKRRQIQIPNALWEKARSLGDGNASAGIRKALESI